MQLVLFLEVPHMGRIIPRKTILGVLAWLALLITSRSALAQSSSQEIRFETADSVKLKGTFYPSGGGNKSPCAILLHKLGGNRQQDGWDDLAKALQTKGFAVLSFDFRGHNDSCEVKPEFFNLPINKKVFGHTTKGKDSKLVKEKIDQKEFVNHKKNYYYTPMLVNDIEAAKQYLDQRNNGNDCNSSNLVLIGAEDGAALGAVWAAAQYRKPHLIANPFGVGVVQDPKRLAEGEDIASAVWLSISQNLARQSIVSTMTNSPIRDRVPMAFVFGDKDDAGNKSANAIFKSMKSASKSIDATKLMAKKGIKSSGHELLKKSLGTTDEICSYLEKIVEKRGNTAWEKRVTPPLVLVQLKPFGFNMLP